MPGIWRSNARSASTFLPLSSLILRTIWSHVDGCRSFSLLGTQSQFHSRDIVLISLEISIVSPELRIGQGNI